MSGLLTARHAVVTGGASGIGAAVARRWAAEGASVVVTDINVEGGTAVAAEIGGTFARLDVRDPEAWDRVISLHGPFDLALLNAGVSTNSSAAAAGEMPTGTTIPLSDLTDDDYRRAMGINLDGVVFGARALMPAMCEARSGDIIATASLAGLVAMSMDPIYGANKHAVVGLVRALAPLLDPYGVCISSLNPGFVDTAILGSAGAEGLRELGFPVLPDTALADLAMQALTERVNGAQWVRWGDIPANVYQWNSPI
jgi:NAD(P)-dependent dehydrogenase (short-subunit alcohol dehydrogenase family)